MFENHENETEGTGSSFFGKTSSSPGDSGNRYNTISATIFDIVLKISITMEPSLSIDMMLS